MKLLVYLRDGRTVFRLRGRGNLAMLVNAEPWSEDVKSLTVERGIWNPTTGEYVWRVVRIRSLAKTSISYVEEESYANSEAST